MGLTIHWKFKASDTAPVEDIRAILNKMRSRAMDLPFLRVEEIKEFEGENTNFNLHRGEGQDADRWMLIQCQEDIALRQTEQEKIEKSRSYIDVNPTHVLGFTIVVAKGSEPMNIILAKYPAKINHHYKTYSSRKKGWTGRSFCKTQYASEFGVDNFLRAHMSVVRMLDYAKELGILNHVSDEGGFWKKRNVKALAEEVGSWNEMIAGFVGKMKDTLGDNFVAPITGFSDFEHLEAKGQGKVNGVGMDRLLAALAVKTKEEVKG